MNTPMRIDAQDQRYVILIIHMVNIVILFTALTNIIIIGINDI